MQSISIGFGKVTYSTSSATLTGFVLEAPFVRTLASKKIVKSQPTLRIPAGHNPEIDGWLFQDTLDGPPGTLILVQMQFKYRGAGLRDGAVLIRLREDGTQYLITAKLPSDPRSILPSNRHTIFSGAGDILTPADAYDAGIRLPKHYAAAFMDDEEVAECFDIQVVRKARSPAPTYEVGTTPEGEKVTFATPRVVRRMRVKRT